MIDTNKRKAVLALHEAGMSLREMARRLHISRRTLRRIIKYPEQTAPRPRKRKVELDEELLRKLYAECDGCIERVREKLAEEHRVPVKYSTLTQRLREIHLSAPPSVAVGRSCRSNNFVKESPNFLFSVNGVQLWLSHFQHDAKEIHRLRTTLGADIEPLLSFLKHSRARNRKKAATILARARGISNSITARALYSSRKTTRRYFKLYTEVGIRGLFPSNTTRTSPHAAEDDVKTKRILELLHNKPTFFGINRTSWTQPALFTAYSRSFGATITRAALTRLLRHAGYRWRKARRVLTSPDPCYHEKVELLIATIHSLSCDEMFFFLDEWGPVQVKKRGGRAYRRQHPVSEIPRHQTPRGTVSLLGALSATTNCVTWFFVGTKDSAAMSDLFEILFNRYHSMRKLYVTWDAVAWHNSASLLDALDRFNEATLNSTDGPIIELVPLPTSAQFLNVIEGVLSGMTRAVVDNSDYPSPVEMKRAISRHFVERNEHFRDNPKRAGKKIWDLDFFRSTETLRAGDYLK